MRFGGLPTKCSGHDESKKKSRRTFASSRDPKKKNAALASGVHNV